MKFLRTLFTAAALFLLSACSIFAPPYQDYAFSYEFRGAGQHVAILEYQLSAGNAIIETFEPNVNQPRSRTTSISPRATGPIPQFLHIKWIDESTGQIYERTADLRPHMPSRLVSSVIYVTLQENKLRVYLADLQGKVTTPRDEESPYSNLPAIVLYSEN